MRCSQSTHISKPKPNWKPFCWDSTNWGSSNQYKKEARIVDQSFIHKRAKKRISCGFDCFLTVWGPFQDVMVIKWHACHCFWDLQAYQERISVCGSLQKNYELPTNYGQEWQGLRFSESRYCVACAWMAQGHWKLASWTKHPIDSNKWLQSHMHTDSISVRADGSFRHQLLPVW